ncbi:MAG: glycosyltransferase family 1 protein [Micropruina sp.]
MAFNTKCSPGGIADFLSRERMKLGRKVILYNPGYFSGPSRCQQLLTIHDLIHITAASGSEAARNRLYYEGVVRPTVRRAGLVLTVSDASADAIREWLRDESVRVVNAGNGCSAQFNAQAVGVRYDRPYFLYVGNFKKHKNPRPALAAMAAFPDHLLAIVTSDIGAAKRMAAELHVDHQVRIVSNVDDVNLASLYAGCEALVFPSVLEGFGLPVLEALRCGARIVFYSGAVSVRDICEGTQFDVDDPSSVDGFADAMRRALAEPYTRPPTIDRYDWDLVGARVDLALKELLRDE